MHEDVVPRKGGGLVAPHHPLDLVKGLEDLVQAVLHGIKVHKRIMDLRLAGEIGQKCLVGRHSLVVLAGHGIQRGQAVPVPVVVGGQADGFAYLIYGLAGITEPCMAKAHVIMGGVIVGESLKYGGEAVHRRLRRSVVIGLYGIHEQGLGGIPQAGRAVLGQKGGSGKAQKDNGIYDDRDSFHGTKIL